MSEVAICNQALGWLGANLITSLDDESTEAQLCKLNYNPLRDAVLERVDWSFAIKRFVAAPLVQPPAYHYSHAFELDSEVLRVITVSASADDYPQVEDWVVEDRKILMNYNTCYYRAVTAVTDSTRFSPLFVQALAARLAADMAIPLTNSRTLQEDMFKIYVAKVREAKASDGRQGRSQQTHSPYLRNSRRVGAYLGPKV